jgi:hypothetical protein
MRQSILGAAMLAAAAIACWFAISPPAMAAATNFASAIPTIRSQVASDVTPVDCRSYWHRHRVEGVWVRHICGCRGLRAWDDCIDEDGHLGSCIPNGALVCGAA